MFRNVLADTEFDMLFRAALVIIHCWRRS